LSSSPGFEHDAVWARQLAESLTARGIDPRPLLSACDLQLQALKQRGARVPFIRSARFFELAAEAVGDDCHGLHFAMSRDIRDAGLIAYVGLASPTVGDALKNVARYRHVSNDALEMDTSRLDDLGEFTWHFRRPARETIRQFREFSAAILLKAVRKYCGREVRPLAMSFRHARNTALGEFKQFFGCSITFAASRNMMQLQCSDVSAPLFSADERLLEILKEHCAFVLNERSQMPESLVEKVEQEIVNRLAQGDAKLELIAGALGIGARTLARRLAEPGTSFNGILASLRDALALRYLKHSDLSLTEIAFLLGYAEISAFTHAFKRWRGVTPTAYRAAA